MKSHKIFTGSLFLAFVLAVSLLTATLTSAIIGGRPE